jgi:hypothetical protein
MESRPSEGASAFAFAHGRARRADGDGAIPSIAETRSSPTPFGEPRLQLHAHVLNDLTVQRCRSNLQLLRRPELYERWWTLTKRRPRPVRRPGRGPISKDTARVSRRENRAARRLVPGRSSESGLPLVDRLADLNGENFHFAPPHQANRAGRPSKTDRSLMKGPACVRLPMRLNRAVDPHN